VTLKDIDQNGSTSEYWLTRGNSATVIFETSENCFNWSGTTIIGFSSSCPTNAKVNLVIPNKCTEIAQGAFANHEEIQNVTLPNNLTTINAGAFYDTGISSITIPGSVKNIGNQAFARCSNLKSVVLSEGVTEIGNMAFIQCTSLTSVTLPDSVTKVYDTPFQGCSSLTSISAPSALKGTDQEGGASEYNLTHGNNATIIWR
jgi:hypothetical protein